MEEEEEDMCLGESSYRGLGRRDGNTGVNLISRTTTPTPTMRSKRTVMSRRGFSGQPIALDPRGEVKICRLGRTSFSARVPVLVLV